jgi:hypothetical protein
VPARVWSRSLAFCWHLICISKHSRLSLPSSPSRRYRAVQMEDSCAY